MDFAVDTGVTLIGDPIIRQICGDGIEGDATSLIVHGVAGYAGLIGGFTNSPGHVTSGVDAPSAAGVRVGGNFDVQARAAAGVDSGSAGWRLGDPVTKQTAAGNDPAWSTVRQRIWKNEALNNAGEYDTIDLERMKRGLAPQRLNWQTGRMESKEIHHETPQREGGSHGLDNLTPLWPDEHARADLFRHTGNPQRE